MAKGNTRINVRVEVELEKIAGKWVENDLLAAEIIRELEEAKPDSLLPRDGEGEYRVVGWRVVQTLG